MLCCVLAIGTEQSCSFKALAHAHNLRQTIYLFFIALKTNVLARNNSCLLLECSIKRCLVRKRIYECDSANLFEYVSEYVSEYV